MGNAFQSRFAEMAGLTVADLRRGDFEKASQCSTIRGTALI